MIMEQLTVAKSNKRVFKVVLTGGPCGGKTTGQARLSTFFENLGWKVFRVPETASILLSGGVKFADLTAEEALRFQENLLKTMIQIEDAYFQLAESCSRDCLVICDRGTMDASAFVSKEDWDRIMANNGWNSVDLRDTRYNQIIHLVSASKGAEHFYSLEHHSCRSEGLSLARHLDHRAAEAWIGHPYFDVIDNSTDFDTKLRRMINVVCMKVGLDTGDRLETNARKVKYLVGSLPDDSVFPPYEDFDVIHDYLQTNSNRTQARLRKRGQKGHWSYMLSVRRPKQHGQIVETKVPTTSRDYHQMLQQHDPLHFTICMQRRCFLYNNQYFQLDVFKEPCHPRCRGLVFLETYTTLPLDELAARLPNFLDVRKIVTGEPSYSMYNLSLKEDWQTSKKFCHKLTVEAGEETTECILPYTNGWTLQSVNGF